MSPKQGPKSLPPSLKRTALHVARRPGQSRNSLGLLPEGAVENSPGWKRCGTRDSNRNGKLRPGGTERNLPIYLRGQRIVQRYRPVRCLGLPNPVHKSIRQPKRSPNSSRTPHRSRR